MVNEFLRGHRAGFTRRLRGDAAHPGASSSPWILALAFGGLLANSWRCWRRTHRERRGSQTAALPRTLQTWEGEGGRPDPAVEDCQSAETTPPAARGA